MRYFKVNADYVSTSGKGVLIEGKAGLFSVSGKDPENAQDGDIFWFAESRASGEITGIAYLPIRDGQNEYTGITPQGKNSVVTQGMALKAYENFEEAARDALMDMPVAGCDLNLWNFALTYLDEGEIDSIPLDGIRAMREIACASTDDSMVHDAAVEHVFGGYGDEVRALVPDENGDAPCM